MLIFPQRDRVSMADSETTRTRPLSRGDLPRPVWSHAVPIRFRHCDPAGIVFTPRYFEILNETVEVFFGEALGIDYYAVLGERQIGLGYAHAACDFMKPSRMGEVLDVAVVVDRIGRSSYTLICPIMKQGVEVGRGRLVTVSTTLATLAACPIPSDIRDALGAYRDRCGAVPALSSPDRA